MLTTNNASFARASASWSSLLPNPIVIVEAINNDRKRAPFSNTGGDISAPGVGIVSTITNLTYDAFSGTSMAAPQISGILGLLMAYDPFLTLPEYKDLLYEWMNNDTSEDASARVDAFSSLIAMNGAAKLLVDVNGHSVDGNRRVILGESDPVNKEGIEIGPDLISSSDEDPTTGAKYRTDPDGTINMRDFRRFRDAWLQICEDEIGLGEDECSGVNFVSLNGADDHPKKDLNFDRCVNQGASDLDCPLEEGVYPRFDFNGDGFVSLVEQSSVPIKPDGSPAGRSNEATMMTDLEVLQSQWHPDTAQTEGYSASDLVGLMVSADLEIHAKDLFAEGGSEVEVAFIITGTEKKLPTRTIAPDEEFIVYTVPAKVELRMKPPR